MKKHTDFSQGSVAGNLLRMAGPMILAQLVSVLYSIVDRMYIGHIPGVGLTFPVVDLISVFSVSAEHISETKATLKFQQYDPSVTAELSFGEPFAVQKKDGENWKEADIIVEGEYGFHDVAYAYFLLR